MKFLNNLKILHLANNFAVNTLYANLLDNLSNLSISSSAICFSGQPSLLKNKIRPSYDYPVYFKFIKKPLDRFLYHRKINRCLEFVFEVISRDRPFLIHAHTLYSDGAIAYEVKRKFKIPYIVAIRNSDLNVFAKWRPDLSSYRDQILLESDGIILISPAYKAKLCSLLKTELWLSIVDKIHIIPNGVDDFWFSDETPVQRENMSEVNLLYVGDFSKNKNVHGLLKAFNGLDASMKASLTIVGGGGDWDKKIKNLIKNSSGKNIRYEGILHDRNELRTIYRKSDLLIIPSFHETFGLSYIEAMSQGVPCIHSIGEGIDGYFSDGTVSMGCNPKSVNDIIDKIVKMSGSRMKNSVHAFLQP